MSRSVGIAAVRMFVCCLSCCMLVAVAGCEKTGPVEKSELDRVLERLEKGGATGAAAEKRLEQTSPYITWGRLAPLIERRSAPADARIAAIRVVSVTAGDLGLPGAVARAARDPDAGVRSEAIRAIVQRADPDNGRVLRNFAEATQDEAVKADLTRGIQELKARERDWYLGRVGNPARTADERAMAARWLSEIGKEEDVLVLVKAAMSFPSEQLLQQEVILAVSRIGGAEAKRFVRETLVSNDPFMRGISAFAETRLRDPEAVPRLSALLADEKVGDTRISAAQALAAIATDDSKAELAKSCKLGQPDPRVDAACTEAQKMMAKHP